MDLKYDDGRHVRCQIILQSGRTIRLEALDQRLSYAGLLEGVPNSKSNNWFIKSSLREAKQHCAVGARPHLIPPSRRDYFLKPGDMQPYRKERPHYVPEWLPSVRCIGAFVSLEVARDSDCDVSVLVVVWFQNEYAPPIREPALGLLLSLEWDSLATDVNLY